MKGPGESRPEGGDAPQLDHLHNLATTACAGVELRGKKSQLRPVKRAIWSSLHVCCPWGTGERKTFTSYPRLAETVTPIARLLQFSLSRWPVVLYKIRVSRVVVVRMAVATSHRTMSQYRRCNLCTHGEQMIAYKRMRQPEEDSGRHSNMAGAASRLLPAYGRLPTPATDCILHVRTCSVRPTHGQCFPARPTALQTSCRAALLTVRICNLVNQTEGKTVLLTRFPLCCLVLHVVVSVERPAHDAFLTSAKLQFEVCTQTCRLRCGRSRILQ